MRMLKAPRRKFVIPAWPRLEPTKTTDRKSGKSAGKNADKNQSARARWRRGRSGMNALLWRSSGYHVQLNGTEQIDARWSRKPPDDGMDAAALNRYARAGGPFERRLRHSGPLAWTGYLNAHENDFVVIETR